MDFVLLLGFGEGGVARPPSEPLRELFLWAVNEQPRGNKRRRRVVLVFELWWLLQGRGPSRGPRSRSKHMAERFLLEQRLGGSQHIKSIRCRAFYLRVLWPSTAAPPPHLTLRPAWRRIIRQRLRAPHSGSVRRQVGKHLLSRWRSSKFPLSSTRPLT